MPEARELETEGDWHAAERLEASNTGNHSVSLVMRTAEPWTAPGKDPRCTLEVQNARPKTRKLRKPCRRAEKERLEERRRADEIRWKPRRGLPEHSEEQARRTSKHQDDQDKKNRTRRCLPRRCSPRTGRHARWPQPATETLDESEGETLRRAVHHCQGFTTGRVAGALCRIR
ncbi:hypothetical protein PF005_g10725 [Phytophthora fragariae]|uniref:Uncharacterized protein n=1 Tax=Phytophthora fragariae TaxID=53985 RepID=A0A6A3K9D3_9STRA|nr:hypothetical protein PF003_g7865 [Phytophthora fragariae]KAE9004270.1 hypothetical protein PF011_g12523 [Phytophthora fragariae]KAE9107180.1 hypothetical protein PF010_g12362 [Phytophthora fragariae]KAE9107594.1 hypothetical protein PF007_g12985 [Phytophthora fragariae]KAE9199928.1 hypothetical protein PF002_g21999 [Phytophthora fragariae]